MKTDDVTTQRLDHLGIVAGICHQIGLVKLVDEFVGDTDRKVSVGEAVVAMILNALGFVGRPLYLTPEFFHNKPVGLLIRDGLNPEDFNDDSIGRALDFLYESGLTEMFAHVSTNALNQFGIEHRFLHLDTSSFSLNGRYNDDSDDPNVIRITQGNSKDHRPDLKQAVVALITSYKSQFPTWLQTLSGNSADKDSFPEIIEAYIKQLKSSGDTPYFIADSALYSESNIKRLSMIFWITRVPRTLKLVQELEQTIQPADMMPAEQEGYRYLELCTTYGDVKQRWLVIYSEKLYQQHLKTLDKKVKKEQETATSSFKHFQNKEFESLPEAETVLQQLQNKWRFHYVDAITTQEVPHYNKKGRPAKNQPPDRIAYRLTGQIIQDQVAVEATKKSKGKFTLATNELDNEKLSTQTILTAYKAQAVSVERGFRFLKDPMFFAHSLFLDKPQRIMALLTVMGLSLLVYALAEHSLRKQLKEQNQTIPNQLGKPNQNPTMRRVFQIFEGIDVLIVKERHKTKFKITNLRPIHQQIVELLGPEIMKIYYPHLPDG